MRGARFLLAFCAALALAGCVHEQYAQQPSPRATSPAAPARHLYSASPAYAQQAYEQPAYQMVDAPPAPTDDRGLFNSRAAAPVYAAPRATARRWRTLCCCAIQLRLRAGGCRYGGGERPALHARYGRQAARRGVRPGRHHQQLRRRCRRQGQPSVDRCGDGARSHQPAIGGRDHRRGSSKVMCASRT